MGRNTGLVLLSVFLLACGRSDRTADHQFSITHEDGVEVRVTTGGPKHQEDLFRYEMVCELRFDEEVEESLLIRPWSFTMDEEGKFYVADSGNHRIAVFDADGTYQRSIGQRGRGPGDLFGPIEVEIVAGMLRVAGAPGDQTTFFTLDGRFVESLRFDRATMSLRQMYRIDPDCVLAVLSLRDSDSESMRFGMRVLVLNSDQDTLATVDAAPIDMAVMRNAKTAVYIMSTGTLEVRERAIPSYLHYTGLAQAAYLPARQEILVTNGQEPILDFYGLDGRLRSRIRVDVHQERVTQEEKDELTAIFDQDLEDARAREGPRAQMAVIQAQSAREILIVPDMKAWWAGFVVDDEGYIWLLRPRIQDGRATNRTRSVRVLSPKGEYLGDSTWPASYMGGNILRGHLLVIRLDPETDEWIPTVYRMIPAVDGFRYP